MNKNKYLFEKDEKCETGLATLLFLSNGVKFVDGKNTCAGLKDAHSNGHYPKGFRSDSLYRKDFWLTGTSSQKCKD